jgi:hypothetical protein
VQHQFKAFDIKVTDEANRIAVDMIRRIRGLDDVGKSAIVITNRRRFDQSE